ncbi:hypothetical protein CKF46_37490, partial [Klebsiella pneumoniae]
AAALKVYPPGSGEVMRVRRAGQPAEALFTGATEEQIRRGGAESLPTGERGGDAREARWTTS